MAFEERRYWISRSLSGIDELSIHHTVSPNHEWTEAEEWAHLLSIRNQHAAPLRFDPYWLAPGIGYWFCVFPSGRVYQTGRLDQQRASVSGQNHHIIGAALVGTFTTESPTDAAMASLTALQSYLEGELARPLARRPHRYYGFTACPGDALTALLAGDAEHLSRASQLAIT